jgi:hypothetical protein
VCLAVFLTGCSGPRFEGPQVQEPPLNFFFDANATQGRNVFPDRRELAQGGWWHSPGEYDHSSVFITTYDGPSTQADVQAARDRQEEEYGQYVRYSDLEALWIDGHAAWGWLETQILDGTTESLEYKVVVSYDSVSYAVEFFSSEPEWMDSTNMRDVVMSFAVGVPRGNMTAKVVAVVLAVTVLLLFWRGKGSRSSGR